MPSKIQLDENLWFLYTCLQNSDYKSIDFNGVGAATNLKAPAARMRYTRLRRAIESGTLIGTHGTPFQGGADKIADAQKKRKKSPAASDGQDTPIAQKHANARENRKSKSTSSPSYLDDAAQTSDTEDAPMGEDHGSVNQAHSAPIKPEPFDPDAFHPGMNGTTSPKEKSFRHVSSTKFPDSFASSEEISPSPREPKRRRSYNSAATNPLQQSPSLHSLGSASRAGYHEEIATPVKPSPFSKFNLASKYAATSAPDHSPFESPASLKFEDADDATTTSPPAIKGFASAAVHARAL